MTHFSIGAAELAHEDADKVTERVHKDSIRLPFVPTRRSALQLAGLKSKHRPISCL